MKKVLYIIALLFLVSCELTKNVDVLQYVDPFVGTSYTGHTFPGAAYPFGFMQPGPQTGNFGWEYCSGYRYEDTHIWGFSQNRLNGTGVPDLGDLLVMPFSGRSGNDFKSTYLKETEIASPGYYSVSLDQNSVDVEITSSPHVAMYRCDFKKDNPGVLIDFQNLCVGDKETYKDRILGSEITIEDNNIITGRTLVRGWVTREYYYVITFEKPFKMVENVKDTVKSKAPKKIVYFDLPKGDRLCFKISFSTVSIDGAKNNLLQEVPHWDFEEVRRSTEKEWKSYLSLIDIDGTDRQKSNFYTSMYHLFLQPNNIADVDGYYRGVNDSVYLSSNGKYYSTLSLWDTFRAANPMYSILCPNDASDMINSMLEHAEVQNYLPIWTLWGKENYCMIGNHGVAVVAEACMKNLPGIDHERAYKAIKESLTVPHYNSEWDIYNKYGYFPFDLILKESVSKTLEFCYDDYSAAMLAQKLGKTDDYDFFLKRSNNYRNLFDSESRLMRGKDSEGKWRTPFNSFRLSHGETRGGDYTEGNSWQYSWHVMQDVDGLIDLMGGKKSFVSHLDSLFAINATEEQLGGALVDVTGLIGQYAHGNEPSHHVIYLYSLAGRNDRTAEIANKICNNFYNPEPDGLCGNDDCGQMSAWYIFTSLGFYPVNPVSGEFVIGSPQVQSARIKLPNGKEFRIETENWSEKNIYVKYVMLNGVPIRDYKFSYADLMNGGVLKFGMTDKSNI